jgi:putative RecB family exonuclease
VPDEQTLRSYSQVNQLRRCGEAYRLARIERVPQQPSVLAELGTAVHTATEFIDATLYNGTYTHLDDLLGQAIVLALDEFEKQAADSDWPVEAWRVYGKQDATWARDAGIAKTVLGYFEWRQEGTFDLFDIPAFGPAIEVPFELDMGEYIIRGQIDRLMIDPLNDQLLVLDIKTGLKPKTDEQLGVYRLALERQYDMPVAYGAYLYGIKSGNPSLTKPVDLSYWTEDMLRRVYDPADVLIRQGLFLPSPGEQCFTCDVREHCEFGRSSI